MGQKRYGVTALDGPFSKQKFQPRMSIHSTGECYLKWI